MSCRDDTHISGVMQGHSLWVQNALFLIQYKAWDFGEVRGYMKEKPHVAWSHDHCSKK